MNNSKRYSILNLSFWVAIEQNLEFHKDIYINNSVKSVQHQSKQD